MSISCFTWINLFCCLSIISYDSWFFHQALSETISLIHWKGTMSGFWQTWTRILYPDSRGNSGGILWRMTLENVSPPCQQPLRSCRIPVSSGHRWGLHPQGLKEGSLWRCLLSCLRRKGGIQQAVRVPRRCLRFVSAAGQWSAWNIRWNPSMGSPLNIESQSASAQKAGDENSRLWSSDQKRKLPLDFINILVYHFAHRTAPPCWY